MDTLSIPTISIYSLYLGILEFLTPSQPANIIAFTLSSFVLKFYTLTTF